jgi:hypothetical protein
MEEFLKQMTLPVCGNPNHSIHIQLKPAVVRIHTNKLSKISGYKINTHHQLYFVFFFVSVFLLFSSLKFEIFITVLWSYWGTL